MNSRDIQISKNNNKGFTLLELVISFGILAIISVAVVGIMSTGMRFFRSTSSSVGLQYEYQTVMTKLREYVVDCNAGITFEDDVLYVVTKDFEDPADGANRNIRYTTQLFVRSGPTLYLGTHADFSDINKPAYIDPAAIDVTDADRFFEISLRMTDFDVYFDIITVDEDGTNVDYATSIVTAMGFSSGLNFNSRYYDAEQEIAMRNRVATETTYEQLRDRLEISP